MERGDATGHVLLRISKVAAVGSNLQSDRKAQISGAVVCGERQGNPVGPHKNAIVPYDVPVRK